MSKGTPIPPAEAKDLAKTVKAAHSQHSIPLKIDAIDLDPDGRLKVTFKVPDIALPSGSARLEAGKRVKERLSKLNNVSQKWQLQSGSNQLVYMTKSRIKAMAGAKPSTAEIRRALDVVAKPTHPIPDCALSAFYMAVQSASNSNDTKLLADYLEHLKAAGFIQVGTVAPTIADPVQARHERNELALIEEWNALSLYEQNLESSSDLFRALAVYNDLLRDASLEKNELQIEVPGSWLTKARLIGGVITTEIVQRLVSGYAVTLGNQAFRGKEYTFGFSPKDFKFAPFGNRVSNPPKKAKNGWSIGLIFT